ncbi:hypothetical protein BH09MYX1_BH09MYX1_16670 [soil metagenome]
MVKAMARRPRFPVISAAAVLSISVVATAACSSGTNKAASMPIVAASPPKDDGQPAQGSTGGVEHAAALEELRTAPVSGRPDRQNAIAIPLPDADHWMRVKFWGIPTLVGFRYGQGHHAVVGGYVTHVDDNTAPGACTKSFEKWALPLIEAYDIDIKHDTPSAFSWHKTPETTDIISIESLFASAATLIEQSEQAVAYAAYPAWKGSCLIVGVGVPVRDGDSARARAVRDRFVKDVLPFIRVTSEDEPPERY